MRLILTIFSIALQSYMAFAQLEGYYQSGNSIGEPGFCSICFKKSGQFLYTATYDVGPTRIEIDGNYQLIQDTLILNSYYQPEDYLKLIQSSRINSDSLIVVVTTVSGELPFFCQMLINDTIKFNVLPKNENGIFKLAKNFVKSISFHTDFSQWNTLRIKKLINPETTLIVATLDDTIGYYRCYIKNEKFIIRKNKLIEIATEYQRVFQKRIDLKNCMN